MKSLTGQRHDRVQTESQQLQPWTAVSTLLGLVKSKQLSTVAIVGLQFGLYHVVAPLSFSRSISLALFVISTKANVRIEILPGICPVIKKFVKYSLKIYLFFQLKVNAIPGQRDWFVRAIIIKYEWYKFYV